MTKTNLSLSNKLCAQEVGAARLNQLTVDVPVVVPRDILTVAIGTAVAAMVSEV